jgi:hypothetical protein
MVGEPAKSTARAEERLALLEELRYELASTCREARNAVPREGRSEVSVEELAFRPAFRSLISTRALAPENKSDHSTLP